MESLNLAREEELTGGMLCFASRKHFRFECVGFTKRPLRRGLLTFRSDSNVNVMVRDCSPDDENGSSARAAQALWVPIVRYFADLILGLHF